GRWGGPGVRGRGVVALFWVGEEGAGGGGVRGVGAVTGHAARHNANRMGRLAKAGAAELKVQLEELPERVAALIDDRRRLEREVADARRKLAMGGGERSGGDDVRQVGDVRLLARAVSGIEVKDLK